MAGRGNQCSSTLHPSAPTADRSSLLPTARVNFQGQDAAVQPHIPGTARTLWRQRSELEAAALASRSSIIDESAAGERCALQYLHLVEDDSRYELEETFETLLCSFLHTISVCGTRAFAAAATLPLERPQKFQNNKVPTFLQASPQCLLSSLSIIQHVVFVS